MKDIQIKANTNQTIICLDAGHGGEDGGTNFGDLIEKNINLRITLKLKELLEKDGYMVVMTRQTDCHLCEGRFIKKIDLQNRVDIINNSGATLFLSIHVNSFPEEKYYGAQVFYSNFNDKNALLANCIQDYLAQFTDTNRKIKLLNEVYILKNAKITGCLIECGFLSNHKEYNLLKTDAYLDVLAKTIMFGVKQYLIVN